LLLFADLAFPFSVLLLQCWGVGRLSSIIGK
jgi:hypothetical protein